MHEAACTPSSALMQPQQSLQQQTSQRMEQRKRPNNTACAVVFCNSAHRCSCMVLLMTMHCVNAPSHQIQGPCASTVINSYTSANDELHRWLEEWRAQDMHDLPSLYKNICITHYVITLMHKASEGVLMRSLPKMLSSWSKADLVQMMNLPK